MDSKDQRAAQISGAAQNRIQMKVTPDMIRASKSITCECGGMLFQEKIFFKILSALISPSGKEETIPMPVFVCTNCGKVPSVFDAQNILPEEIRAKLFIEQTSKGFSGDLKEFPDPQRPKS